MPAWYFRLGGWYWQQRSKRELRKIDRLIGAKLLEEDPQ